MSGRFTYLDLLEDDHMLPRYAKAWGEREASLDRWRRHGAMDYLTKATVRALPFNNPDEEGRCILTGKPSHRRVLFARAY